MLLLERKLLIESIEEKASKVSEVVKIIKDKIKPFSADLWNAFKEKTLSIWSNFSPITKAAIIIVLLIAFILIVYGLSRVLIKSFFKLLWKVVTLPFKLAWEVLKDLLTVLGFREYDQDVFEKKFKSDDLTDEEREKFKRYIENKL
jgi:uncharacterized membrane protein